PPAVEDHLVVRPRLLRRVEPVRAGAAEQVELVHDPAHPHRQAHPTVEHQRHPELLAHRTPPIDRSVPGGVDRTNGVAFPTEPTGRPADTPRKRGQLTKQNGWPAGSVNTR